MNNPANPDPSQTIRWGDKSEEEMFSNYFEYLDPEKRPGSVTAHK